MQPAPAGVTPGKDFLYSNGGYALVGAMIEAASGKPFETVFNEELMDPLGVPGSWGLPELTGADQPFGHEGPRGQLAVVAPFPPELQQWEDVMGTAGDLSTTPAGYETWLRWHLRALRGHATPPSVWVSAPSE
jgi:CubicO group peptidase (beta-lactamase class C family)